MLFYRRFRIFCIYLLLLLLLFKLLWKWILKSLTLPRWMTSVRFFSTLWIITFITIFILPKSPLLEILIHRVKNKFLHILAIHLNVLTCKNLYLKWTLSFFCLLLLDFNSDRSTFLEWTVLKIVFKSFVKWSILIEPLLILLWLKLKTTLMIFVRLRSLCIQVHSESIGRFRCWSFW